MAFAALNSQRKRKIIGVFLHYIFHAPNFHLVMKIYIEMSRTKERKIDESIFIERERKLTLWFVVLHWIGFVFVSFGLSLPLSLSALFAFPQKMLRGFHGIHSVYTLDECVFHFSAFASIHTDICSYYVWQIALGTECNINEMKPPNYIRWILVLEASAMWYNCMRFSDEIVYKRKKKLWMEMVVAYWIIKS